MYLTSFEEYSSFLEFKKNFDCKLHKIVNRIQKKFIPGFNSYSCPIRCLVLFSFLLKNTDFTFISTYITIYRAKIYL